ncbi:hypothetical protein EIN_122880 [Entamoeba invadens IP1]|uniref:Thioredoxin domain-containing protein n=1 Tax=Entamoeba invadens IP1 TaxID=370355 RepID=A0A0A1UB02_ENTIV|nr:hypothetical protein EIN_122880 [Entamoeba invadens IP1]ELP92337.1 hypothetical protein EIN_122880 [Entamoeba invadens IP1]|eukprot:XP_004259108.1 hypothetical protein EIN_122880 [Entamoeba invadens IP1]
MSCPMKTCQKPEAPKEEQKTCCQQKACCQQEPCCPVKAAYMEFLKQIPRVAVDEPAPLFKAPEYCPNCDAVIEFELEKHKGKTVVLVFYPHDWTYICPTEILGFGKLAQEMPEVVIVGVSVDSAYSHKAWANAPREKGGLGGSKIGLVSDITHKVSMMYGMFNPCEAICRRGCVIIDKNQIIRFMEMNGKGFGRSTDEIKRIIEAINFSDEHGEMCPCNWMPGKDTVKPCQEGICEYLKKL